MSTLTLLAACVALLLAPPGCKKRDGGSKGGGERVLNLYTWSEYFPEDVLKKFTERTGIKVRVSTFSNNEELMQKLGSGVSGFDLVVPSDYVVDGAIEAKLIQPLDHGKLPNFKNVDKRFLDAKYDPGSKHSVPFMWGTTGIGYDKEHVPGGVDSWRVLFDAKYERKILMLDDARECLAVGLRLAGKSINETDPAALRQAADLLKGQRPLVKAYNSEEFADALAAKDVVLSHGYNGQIAKKIAEAPGRLEYALPKEGGTLWVDNLCIPAGAKNVAEAHELLNFILEPEVAAEFVHSINYASCNGAAKKHIKPEILNDRHVYPTDEMLKGFERMEAVDAEISKLIDRLWTEIKAQ